jgi:hypothetical protein
MVWDCGFSELWQSREVLVYDGNKEVLFSPMAVMWFRFVCDGNKEVIDDRLVPAAANVSAVGQ